MKAILLRLYEFHPDGTARTILLGRDIAAGQVMQHTIKAGVFRQVKLHLAANGRSLPAPCHQDLTQPVLPGYTKSELLGKYAGCEEIIDRMGVPDGHETELPADYVNERFKG